MFDQDPRHVRRLTITMGKIDEYNEEEMKKKDKQNIDERK